MLHGMGREFGATTGRARRCGWFDAVATRYAGMINGIDELAVTNLDGLDSVDDPGLRRLQARGKRLEVPPRDAAQLENCEPIYEEMPGWKTPTEKRRSTRELPARPRATTCKRIAELTGREADDRQRRPGARPDHHVLA